jgi:hypothetical protein
VNFLDPDNRHQIQVNRTALQSAIIKYILEIPTIVLEQNILISLEVIFQDSCLNTDVLSALEYLDHYCHSYICIKIIAVIIIPTSKGDHSTYNLLL